jgi:hypothetical protein
MISNEAHRYLISLGKAAWQADELCAGLPCLIDPDLMFRADQPEWSAASHVHPLYYTGESHAGMRWALIALAPDHFPDLRGRLSVAKPPTAPYGTNALNVLLCRCLAATRDATYQPLRTTKQFAPPAWARALTLADLGRIELADEARSAYENRRPFNANKAGMNGRGPPKSIKDALIPTRHFFEKGLSRTLGVPNPELLLAVALACSLALRQRDDDALSHLLKLVPKRYQLIPLDLTKRNP